MFTKIISIIAVAIFLNSCVMKEQVVDLNKKDETLTKTLKKIKPKKRVVAQSKQEIQKVIDTQKSDAKREEIDEAKPVEGVDTFRFPTLNGKILKVNMSGLNMEFLDPEYSGKSVMIFMFGYDCPHCLKEMTTIRRLQNDPRLKIVGIHAKSMIGDDRLRSFARSKGLNFDILSFKNDIKMIRFLRDAGLFDDEVPTAILIHPNSTMELVYPETVLSKI